MVFHPPMLYLGYISITIPFAFAIAALLTKKLDTEWLVAVRKWTIVSGLFLSIGLLIGMGWAFEELGWGGDWARGTRGNGGQVRLVQRDPVSGSGVDSAKRGVL